MLLRPAVEALQRAGARVTLLAPLPAAGVVLGEGLADVHEVWPWDAPDVSALLAGDPGPAAARGRFEAAVVMSRSRDLARALGPLCGTVVTGDPSPPPGVHASVPALEAARQAVPAVVAELLPSGPEPPDASGVDRGLAAAVLRRLGPDFLAVHPGSGSPGKNWPSSRFAGAARALSPGARVLVVRGPADEDACRNLATLPNAVVLDPVLPPRALGFVLGQASLYLGNDSGVSHLAAAWGAPSLVLFGPTDPACWRPLGPSVQVLRAEGGRLEDLPVETVVAVALGLGTPTSPGGGPRPG